MAKKKDKEPTHGTRNQEKNRVQEETSAQPISPLAELHTIRALSIKQPYAGLIMAGIKNVENRSWLTKYTGPLAIVSSQKPDAAQYWDRMREKCRDLGVTLPEELCKINGSVLGVIDFRYVVYTAEDGVVSTDHPNLDEDAVKDWWKPDLVGFILEHPRILPNPIPVLGRLGLYSLSAEVVAEIAAQFNEGG